jgi:hypothetical protein
MEMPRSEPAGQDYIDLEQHPDRMSSLINRDSGQNQPCHTVHNMLPILTVSAWTSSLRAYHGTRKLRSAKE